MKTLATGALITALGTLGLLWQVDQATSDTGGARAAPAVLLCPLGGHGAYAPRVKDPFD